MLFSTASKQHVQRWGSKDLQAPNGWTSQINKELMPLCELIASIRHSDTDVNI
jgi:hypothetical protein